MSPIQTLREILPTLATDRLALRPLVLADAYPLFQATRNPAFNEHLLWQAPPDIDSLKRRVQSILEQEREGATAAVVAVERDTGRFVAVQRFMATGAPHVLETGYWTHDAFWQGGLTSELLRRTILAAFESAGVKRVWATASEKNVGSCVVLRRLGFRPTHIWHRATEMGTTLPLRVHELSRADWPHAGPK